MVHKQEVSHTSNYNMKWAQIRLMAARRAVTPEWIKIMKHIEQQLSKYLYVHSIIILNSFPQGHFSGSRLMGRTGRSPYWSQCCNLMLLSTLKTCVHECPSGRVDTKKQEVWPNHQQRRIGLWLIPEETPKPWVQVLTAGLDRPLGRINLHVCLIGAASGKGVTMHFSNICMYAISCNACVHAWMCDSHWLKKINWFLVLSE